MVDCTKAGCRQVGWVAISAERVAVKVQARVYLCRCTWSTVSSRAEAQNKASAGREGCLPRFAVVESGERWASQGQAATTRGIGIDIEMSLRSGLPTAGVVVLDGPCVAVTSLDLASRDCYRASTLEAQPCPTIPLPGSCEELALIGGGAGALNFPRQSRHQPASLLQPHSRADRTTSTRT